MLQHLTTKSIIFTLALSCFTHQLLAMDNPHDPVESNSKNIEREVICVADFLEVIAAQFRGDYQYKTPISNAFSSPNNIKKKDLITVHLHNGNGELWIQEVYDPEHILMKNNEFNPLEKPEHILMQNKFNPLQKEVEEFGVEMYKAAGGTRKVGICKMDGKNRFCFKEWPEAPGVEIATYQFAASMYSNDVPLPKSEVILMNGSLFLVSEFIEGYPLEKFLDYRAKNSGEPNKCVLNATRFKKLAAFCMITNPEDCRLPNCLVRKMNKSEEYEFVLIDNERSLGMEETDKIEHLEKGSISTRVHCVLFCFYDMLKKSTEDLKNALLYEMKDSVKLPERLLRIVNENNYQLRLANENNYQSALHNYKKLNKEQEIILGLPLGEKFIENAAEKWSKITFGITSEGKNLANIFREVMPNLANIYLNNPIPNVLEQIKKVDAGRHGEKTPPSAYVKLRNYFFSDKPLTVNDLLILGTGILHKYGERFAPEIKTQFQIASSTNYTDTSFNHTSNILTQNEELITTLKPSLKRSSTQPSPRIIAGKPIKRKSPKNPNIP